MTPHLNRKLILERAERVPDDAGGFIETWQALGSLWAEVRPGTGRERARHTLPRSSVALRIMVRAAPFGAPSRPEPGQRFREGSRIYKIEAVTEKDVRGQYLLCHALEEVAT